MSKKQAFTLIELLIVCILIGFLIAISVPSYFRSVETAKCKEAMQTLTNMASAAFAFYAENDTFVGLNIAAINAQSGIYIVNNDDWSYDVPAATTTSSTFILTSTRLRGPHQAAGNTIIRLNQNSIWGGGANAYPHDNPGNF